MVKRYEMLIQGSLLVTGSGVQKADILIRGERVVAVKSALSQGEANRR
jgi:dihydroorotase-like cyclic amidohydrolase